ncbi:hypothetical protein KEJ32_00925 [Candidatus Bathyarchaeota archaeon]|nr:hypothetical protein [Candidatus Bathyarchaeota archaeon]MBS7637201.1 hypothetical protein [Candidatus Bathyarchaeota archaeon]
MEVEEEPLSESSDQQELGQTLQESAEEDQTSKQEIEQKEQTKLNVDNQGDRSSFIHGLSVGLGLGCISTFIIMWVVVFFTPQISQTLTYESMLSMFIYPMLYLLAVGLIALTAGIVREYYVRK